MTNERKQLLEKMARQPTITLLNAVDFQGAELADLRDKYNTAITAMHECADPCAFCGYSDDGAPRDQYDEDGDFKCYCCNNNCGDVDNWEFICEVERDTPADTPPESPHLFMDSFCPNCGGDTHSVNDTPMKCDRCGWTEHREPPARRDTAQERTITAEIPSQTKIDFHVSIDDINSIKKLEKLIEKMEMGAQNDKQKI